jgi:hypothetical protein
MITLLFIEAVIEIRRSFASLRMTAELGDQEGRSAGSRIDIFELLIFNCEPALLPYCHNKEMSSRTK